MDPEQDSSRILVYLRVIAKKGDGSLSKAPELESHKWMQFNAYLG